MHRPKGPRFTTGMSDPWSKKWQNKVKLTSKHLPVCCQLLNSNVRLCRSKLCMFEWTVS